ncbi:phage integrase family protein [Puniceibacterium sp. IMCC21224]|nr:phage integrase family protein [Puniceibacterium sp. IMCC21224]
MAFAPDMIERLLVELCRFTIEAADLAREVAPLRTPEAAAYEQTCAMAILDVLRQAIHLRDREAAREPLRVAAMRLGIPLDETDPDWQKLAFRALRVMLDAHQENLQREQGTFNGPSPVFRAASRLVDGASNLNIMSRSDWGTAGPTPSHFTSKMPGSQAVLESAQPEANPSEMIQHPIATPAAATEKFADKEPQPTAQKPNLTTACPSIVEGTQTYIDMRSKGYRSFKSTEQANINAGDSWKRNSAPNVSATGRLLTRILGDKPFEQLTDPELTAAWELVARLPRSYQAKTSKLSPREAANDADATELQEADITRAKLKKNGASPGKIESELLKLRTPRLRTATIYRHMQDFQRICVFLRKKGFLNSNIMEDHIWDSAEYDRRDILEEDNERQTWNGKLGGLFRSQIYQDKLEDAGDPMFWAPLIAVHMGLRSEEILQLFVSDIQIIDDVPCIVLSQGPGQSLKSKASRRTVPIHDNLLELGFMKLVAKLKREDEPRLFPWIERSASKKTYTETFSKRFTRYRQDHKIFDAQRDFHSFRTTFNHLLIEAECIDTQRRNLMGHVERDVGITNYNPGGFSKSLLRKRVNSVEIDISMIRPPFQNVGSGSVTDLSAHLTLAQG